MVTKVTDLRLSNVLISCTNPQAFLRKQNIIGIYALKYVILHLGLAVWNDLKCNITMVQAATVISNVKIKVSLLCCNFSKCFNDERVSMWYYFVYQGLVSPRCEDKRAWERFTWKACFVLKRDPVTDFKKALCVYDWNLMKTFFLILLTYHFRNLHKPRQCCCHGMCKIVPFFFFSFRSKMYFYKIRIMRLSGLCEVGCTGISLGMHMGPVNERCRYIVTTSLIGWAHTDPWLRGTCAGEQSLPVKWNLAEFRPYVLSEYRTDKLYIPRKDIQRHIQTADMGQVRHVKLLTSWLQWLAGWIQLETSQVNTIFKIFVITSQELILPFVELKEPNIQILANSCQIFPIGCATWYSNRTKDQMRR